MPVQILRSQTGKRLLRPLPKTKTRYVPKTECPDCMKLFASFNDIPTTLERTLRVWETQVCRGAHTLSAWVADPL